MAVSATAKSLINADSYSTKWHQKRIHRLLDDRDDVLDEALQILESHDASALPRITGITGLSLASSTNASADVTFSIGGSGCEATDTVTLVIGSTTLAVTVAANSVEITTDGDITTLLDAGSAGTILPVYLTVAGVLCPVITLIQT